MDREPPVVLVVRLLAQQIEKLGVDHADEEIEGAVRVAHDEEQGGLAVPQGVQLQLVIPGDLPQFGDVKGSQPSAAGDEDALCRLAGRQLIEPVLADSKVVWLFLFQRLKHLVDRVLERLIVLPDLHSVQEGDERPEVLLLHGRDIVDIGDERRVKELLGFLPELVPALALALRVHHQRCHQLQDVLLRMDIGEGVVVHRLLEVDRVKNLDAVLVPHQDGPALLDDPPFWISDDIRTMAL